MTPATNREVIEVIAIAAVFAVLDCLSLSHCYTGTTEESL